MTLYLLHCAQLLRYLFFNWMTKFHEIPGENFMAMFSSLMQSNVDVAWQNRTVSISHFFADM